LVSPPEVEVDCVKDTDFPKVDSEKITKFSTIDRTRENTEVVIYEDVALTTLADQAEVDRTKVDQLEKSALIIKHTDFHSKLKAVASEGTRKKGERRKKV
jgi:hypothetical protein